jgi:DNA mismatch endonuclease (patch repair protein)
MAAIRSKDTKPELALRRALWAAGVRGWRCHRRDLPGKPDLSWGRWRLALEVDGAFFHGHPEYIRPGASEYWKTKIARNQERDRTNAAALRKQGWEVLRLWDFEVNEDLDGCVGRVIDTLRSRGYDSPGKPSIVADPAPAVLYDSVSPSWPSV